jgi:hypothetical protein
MSKIGRSVYHEAADILLQKAGYITETVGTCKFMAVKDKTKYFIEVAGKNLPYLGSEGQEVFIWETFIKQDRVNATEQNARLQLAKPILAYCYAIIKDSYVPDFKQVVTLFDTTFGLKLISTNNFKDYMQPRSPSWDVVDLPREKVLALTQDP